MKAAILQSNYMPWKGYFDLIHDVDVFVFYDEVKYTKNDWRNRNIIYTKNGKQWLTIPIAKDAVKQKISEVTITDPLWQDLHTKSLELGYKSAKHYPQLHEFIQYAYSQKQWTSLSELNQSIIKKVCELIGIKTRFINSADLTVEGDRLDRLLNVLQQIGAAQYLSGPAAKDYLTGQEHRFAQKGIELIYKNYPDYPAYRQLSEPFEQYVSIVDLIANIPLSEIKNYIYDIRHQAK